MTQFSPGAATFDGIAAFCSLIHLPYGELQGMFGRIAGWLRPGGLLVASLGARANPGAHIEADWLSGAPMYWSGYSIEDSTSFIEAAGLVLVESSIEENVEDGRSAPFLWVIARKPRAAG